MSATHTHQRIIKLHRRGLLPEQIARKIGRPGDVARVMDALAQEELEPNEPPAEEPN